MKVLAFTIGADRYGLPLRSVARVLPAMALKLIPGAPDFVAGLMDLHGVPVPVLDIARLAGMPAEQVWLDSRIVLIDYPTGGDQPRQLGLLVEHVTGIDTIDAALLLDAGIDGAPFLGQVAASLQLIDVDALLAPAVRALLFARTPAAQAAQAAQATP
ncbi:chemotaxis protein CheW [Massilia sp. DWR3-1-1]|uniref:chemotaxis protein CheW n=1 Tax=Massilia sp. DWR3-1-1 TaxID=2804559 RepID=UPI003CF225F9